MEPKRLKRLGMGLGAIFLLALALAFAAGPLGLPVTQAVAAPGDVFQTPVTPMELPVEVEIELSPAGSLKQAALWKELYQLLVSPYAPVVRRPGFGVAMPPLNVYPLDYNFLTAQPVRLRTSDGEVSWDQPGPLFDTNRVLPGSRLSGCDGFNTPTVLRNAVGHMVACPNPGPAGLYQAAVIPANFCDGKPDGSLVVYNPGDNAIIPPNGTVVAMAAFFDNVLHEVVTDADGVPVIDPATGLPELEAVVALETPVNEEDFFRNPADVAGVPAELQPLIGRPAAEILGKALFWDMQIGSDGVQACGSCHFHAGVDNRSGASSTRTPRAAILPCRSRDPTGTSSRATFRSTSWPIPRSPGSPPCGAVLGLPPCADNAVVSDANDVMSSMGVSDSSCSSTSRPIGTFFNAGGVSACRRTSAPSRPTRFQSTRGCAGWSPATPRLSTPPRSTSTISGTVAPASTSTAAACSAPRIPRPTSSSMTARSSARPWAISGPTSSSRIPNVAAQPVRIKFSSLASQSVGPPLSDFEMSFAGRNWAKIGKKMLQAGVTPLANQLVRPDGQRAWALLQPEGRRRHRGMPGLSISYPQLIRLAFRSDLWSTTASISTAPPRFAPGPMRTVSRRLRAATPSTATLSPLPAARRPRPTPTSSRRWRRTSAPSSGCRCRRTKTLTIPDDTPADRFFDANPNAGHGVGEPGDQAVLFPTLVTDLIDDGLLNGYGRSTASR